jgi:hypothetical protein
MGKDAVGDTKPANQAGKIDADHPGYELTDVNASGVAVFLAGLLGFVIMFFFVCSGTRKTGRPTSGRSPRVPYLRARARTWRAIPRCSRKSYSR